MAETAWRSKRLIFRVPNEAKADELFARLQQHPVDWLNWSPALANPRGGGAPKRAREVMQGRLLFAVPCIPDTEAPPGDRNALDPIDQASIPIGMVTLRTSDNAWGSTSHHRAATLGISILKRYQGQGYGTETIQWVLRWAFQWENLHSVRLGVFGLEYEGDWRL
jgi:RimJ/RimL family protein N-acetyltransferase